MMTISEVRKSSGTAAGVRRGARRAPSGGRPAARQTARERGRQVARARRAHCGGHGAFRERSAREDGQENGGDGHPARGWVGVV
jgi:hypothetical protein